MRHNFVETTNGSRQLKSLTYSETIVCTSVSEINDQLKRLVVERFQCQKYMVYQQIAIDIKNSETISNSNHLTYHNYLIH